ncbi:MAG: hypothetical protein Kow0080_36760 [Candidatus Promineifilaceae bacterium]
MMHTRTHSHWRRLGQWLWQQITGISIRYKLLGMVLVAILLLGTAVTLQVQSELAANLRQSLEERGVALTRDLAEDAADLILTQNIFELNQEIRTLLETNLDVRYIFVIDAQGQIVAHSFPNRVPPDLLTVNYLDEGVPWQVQVLDSDEGLITDVAAPIFEGKLGTARIGLSHQRLETAVAEATHRIQLITLAALIVGGVTVLLLTRILTSPIFDLVTAVRAVSQGDLTHRPPVRMDDEIGELTTAFNAMTADLARSRDELLRQNRQLAALNNVARAISGSRSLDEVLTSALNSTLHALACEAGWIVLQDNQDNSHIVASKGLSSPFLARETADHWEPCHCHHVIRGEAPWQTPVLRADCPRLQRALAAQNEERRFDRHLSLPLISHNRPLGILNLALATNQPFSPEQLELAGAIGVQVGVAIDAERQRQRLMAELAEREVLRGQLLERALAAQEAERQRIARELHDEAGQALTSLMVGLRLLEKQAEPSPDLLAQTAALKQTADTVLENLHRLAVDLRPASLDHVGLVAALRQYIELYRRQTGLDVQLEVVGLADGRLPDTIETTLYRIVQEALTNVARHAQAMQVGVLLEAQPDRVVAIVEDDGVGFDPATSQKNGCLGLFGMQERAEMVNGRLTIESTPNQGTTIFVEVPYVHSHSSGR